MSVINSHDWKAFRLGDLFDIIRGTSRTMRMLNAGAMPVIAAARAEQGVAGYYDVSPEYADAITVSCNGVGCGSVFYHDGQFAITGDASVMQEKQEMTREAKLFVAAICDSLFFAKYSYAEKCNPAGLAEELISLPAMLDGQPDWAYMDAYMSEVLKKEEVFAEHLASLTAEAVADGHKLDTSGWKAFRIGELFEVVNTVPYHARYLTEDENGIRYVVRTMYNNGVKCCVRKDSDFKINPSGVISFGSENANFFYQDEEWIGGRDTYYLDTQQLSEFAALFVRSVLQTHVTSRFSYTEAMIPSRFINDVIYLPVTFDGQPDWAWMEQYMQQQMDKAEALVAHLDAVWN